MLVGKIKNELRPGLKSPVAARVGKPVREPKPTVARIIGRAKALTPDEKLIRLFCVWMFLQCFQYKYMPVFNWNIGLSFFPDRIAFGAILVTYLGRPAAPKGSEKPKAGFAAAMVGLLMVTYFVVVTLSYLTSGGDAENQAFRLLTTIFNFPVWPGVAYAIARRLDHSRESIDRILKWLSGICIYLAITNICEHFFPKLVIPSYIMRDGIGIHFGRARGPFLSSVTDGGILLVTFAALACMMAEWTGIKRMITLMLYGFVVLAVYFTETRAIWLGFAAIMATTLLLKTPMRRNSMVLACLLVVGFFSGAGSKFSSGEDTLFSRRQQTVEYRYANYETTYNMFKDHWLFGVGYGRFLHEWDKYFPTGFSQVRELEDGNHSSLLGILAELGILGFLSYGGIILFSFLVCLRAYWHLKGEQWAYERRFALVGLVAVLCFFILGLTSDLRWDQMFDVIGFWLTGVVSSLDVKSQAARIEESSALAPA